MTIQEFLTQFGPWLLGIAAIITSVVGARSGKVSDISKNVETLQKVVDGLVESKERLKKEKEDDSTKFNLEIGKLNEKIRALDKLCEEQRIEIHDLHALIGKDVVSKLKIVIEKDSSTEL